MNVVAPEKEEIDSPKKFLSEEALALIEAAIREMNQNESQLSTETVAKLGCLHQKEGNQISLRIILNLLELFMRQNKTV